MGPVVPPEYDQGMPTTKPSMPPDSLVEPLMICLKDMAHLTLMRTVPPPQGLKLKAMTSTLERVQVHALSALFESFISVTKRTCIVFNREYKLRLYSPVELHFLHEREPVDFQLNSSGRAMRNVRTHKAKFAANLRFTIEMLSRLSGYTVDYGASKWKDTQEFIRIRDRMTHPRWKDDVAITPEVRRTISGAFSLLSDLVSNSYAVAATKFQSLSETQGPSASSSASNEGDGQQP